MKISTYLLVIVLLAFILHCYESRRYTRRNRARKVIYGRRLGRITTAWSANRYYSHFYRFKYSKYKLCHRQYTTSEKLLLHTLINSRKHGLKDYLSKHQQCKISKDLCLNDEQRDAQNIEKDFEGIDIKYRLVRCQKKGEESFTTRTLNMCRECLYQIILPHSFTHRFQYHVTCHGTNDDYSCLLGEGACIANTVEIPLERLKSESNSHSNDRKDYEFVSVRFARSCQCEIIRHSFFRMLVA